MAKMLVMLIPYAAMTTNFARHLLLDALRERKSEHKIYEITQKLTEPHQYTLAS